MTAAPCRAEPASRAGTRGTVLAGLASAEPVPAEPAWLTEVRLRAGRRALWLRSLWADSRYPGEDAMAISHSEVDRAMAPAGELAAAERRFYREDATAAAVSEALDRLLAAGPDTRWDHLTRTLGLSAPDAGLLALALAAEAAPELRRVYGYLGDEAGPVDASPALARALWDWAPDLRIDAGSALLRWRLAWPRDGGPDLCAADSRWIADPLLLAEFTGDGLAARSGPAGRDVEPTAEPVLYPAALDEIVGFAGPAGRRHRAARYPRRDRGGAGRAAGLGQDRACRAGVPEAGQAPRVRGRGQAGQSSGPRRRRRPRGAAGAAARLRPDLAARGPVAGRGRRGARRARGPHVLRDGRRRVRARAAGAACGCGARCRRWTATPGSGSGPRCRASPPRRR